MRRLAGAVRHAGAGAVVGQVRARPGASDCEQFVALVAERGWDWQPANTVSGMAFVAAGLWMLRDVRQRPRRERAEVVALAAALLLVGVGSAAFHGPGGPVAHWLHDVGIVAVLAVIAASDGALLAGRRRGDVPGSLSAPRAAAVCVVLAGAILAVRPLLGIVVGAAAAVVTACAEVAVWRAGRAPRRFARPAYALAVASLLVGFAAAAAARTDGPWCRPESLLQGHAVWHGLAAVAATAWARAALPRLPARRRT